MQKISTMRMNGKTFSNAGSFCGPGLGRPVKALLRVPGGAAFGVSQNSVRGVRLLDTKRSPSTRP
jgi:hypothetical protein